MTGTMTERAPRSDLNEYPPQRVISAKYRNSLTRYQWYVRPSDGSRRSQASSQGLSSVAARASNRKTMVAEARVGRSIVLQTGAVDRVGRSQAENHDDAPADAKQSVSQARTVLRETDSAPFGTTQSIASRQILRHVDQEDQGAQRNGLHDPVHGMVDADHRSSPESQAEQQRNRRQCDQESPKELVAGAGVFGLIAAKTDPAPEVAAHPVLGPEAVDTQRRQCGQGLVMEIFARSLREPP